MNLPLVFDGGELDPTRPEIILYEPLPSGRLRITGADFLVIAKDWDDCAPWQPAAAHGTAVPSVREPQPVRAPGVLHAARLGVEGKPHRHVRELALQRVM